MRVQPSASHCDTNYIPARSIMDSIDPHAIKDVQIIALLDVLSHALPLDLKANVVTSNQQKVHAEFKSPAERSIVQVATAIYTVYNEVKANKAQCEELVKRIRIIEAIVKRNVKPDTVSDDSDDPKVMALVRLQNVLTDCQAEIKQYTDRKFSIRKVYRQLANRDGFAGLHNELDRCQQDLQTTFAVADKDLFVAQNDRIGALQKDLAFLADNMKFFIDLYIKDAPLGSITPQEAAQSFSKRLEKERSIVAAIMQNQGTPTAEEFSDCLIAVNELEVGEEIGKGGFGIVYAGEWNASKVGIKKLHCRADALTPKARKSFKTEARMLLYANHHNVVKFYGLVMDGSNYMLVMEYFEKKCLRTVINQTFESLTWDQKTDYALQIALGMAYLHRQKVIHCDLKCQNILVRDDDSVAIADFGLALVKQDTRNTLTNVNSTAENVGTTSWMAPELFDLGGKPSYASDVYAFAMILFELADGGFPFSDIPHNAIPLRVQQGERPKVPSDTPPLIASVMTRSWSANPSQRPRCGELVVVLKSKDDAILKLSRNKSTINGRPIPTDSAYHSQQPQPAPMPSSNHVERYWSALAAGNTGVVKSILSAKLVDVNLTKDGMTGLHVVCRKNLLDAVKTLLDFGADAQRKDADGKLPIQLSTSLDVWRALAAKVPVPQGDLFDAAEKGDDVSARLILAVQKDPKASLNELREVEPKGWYGTFTLTPLHAAAYHGHLPVCEVLLQAGAEVDGRDKGEMTPLMRAAYQGHFDVAQVLVERGADVHARNKDGNTPLHLAAWRGRVDMARFLLDRGADVNCRNKEEMTPLMRAAIGGHLHVAQVLVERGADVHARDKYGLTPLHWAAVEGHVDTVRFLLERGAEVDCRDEGDNTPLMRAALGGHLHAVQLLVERGAEVHARDWMGKTARDHALQRDRKDIAEFLASKESAAARTLPAKQPPPVTKKPLLLSLFRR
ncbi:hypothetical protein HDU96_009595 [Phlyctochytrium bullatum]|nr:hypothetical protein HDU96_009595 [Phlyctochytrium bullatum]